MDFFPNKNYHLCPAKIRSHRPLAPKWSQYHQTMLPGHLVCYIIIYKLNLIMRMCTITKISVKHFDTKDEKIIFDIVYISAKKLYKSELQLLS
jgi:hypothetical protein